MLFEMDALFACTKCHTRHPFDELSEGKQLCKNCRNNYPIVKCTYCRAEFQQEDKNGTSSICKKCEQNVKNYGKPKACEYCSIIAAFIGNKCQRCANSEKKYGSPQTCEQCKQQCAFDRRDDSRKKVDGKVLCWLCTMAYRRVLAKTKNKTTGTPSSVNNSQNIDSRSNSAQSSPVGRLKTSSSTNSLSGLVAGSGLSKHSQSILNKSSSSSKLTSITTLQSEKSREGSKEKDKESSKSSKEISKSSRDREKEKDKDTKEKEKPLKHKSDSSSESKGKDTPDSGPPAKKQKLEKTSNGITQPKSAMEPISDFSTSDNVVAITQMREEVEALKKQLQIKDQQILDREKKLTELKAQNFEAEKEMRNRIQAIQKQHAAAMEKLQERVHELKKKVTTSKSKSSS